MTDHRAVRGPDPTTKPYKPTVVIRWHIVGTNPRDGKRGIVLASDARPIGQTEQDAWAWYDRTIVQKAAYTNLEAVAITAHGRITYRRTGRAA